MLIIDENSYHKENLDYLFGLLNRKEEINCVLLGYFAKVVSSFFQKNKKEICSYFYSQDANISNFLHHLYSKSLVDPLKNFLVIYPEDHYHQNEESSNENRGNPKTSCFSKFYEKRVKSFQSLYSTLDKAEDFETIANAQYIIETLVAKIDQTVDGGKLLDDVVLRKENMRSLFNCLKSNNKHKRKAAAEILNLTFSLLLNEVIEEPEKRNTMMAATTQANPDFSKLYDQKKKEEKNALFQTFVDELEPIIDGIKKRREQQKTFNNTIGKEVRVVDTGDIRIFQLIQAALKFNLQNLNLIIANSRYFDEFFDHFRNSGWNSSVHTLFAELIKTCLLSNKSPMILNKLAENNRLVEMMYKCVAKDNCYVDEKKVFRKAYCGVINEIGTLLFKSAGETKTLFCNNDVWKAFLEEYLKPIIDIERADRDDVFKRSNKFDRPDFGSNLPFELFNALANLQMNRGQNNQTHEDNNDDNNEADHTDGTEHDENTEDRNGDEHEPEPEHHEHQKDDERKNTTIDVPHVPREIDMVLQHQRSIEEQVITTSQDKDLDEEKHENDPVDETTDKKAEDKPAPQVVKEEEKPKDSKPAEEDDTKLDASIQ